ncbi:CYTH and CHAD domain-containing protein [Glaciihabitans sp. INWT7]|uniref:CYTH and CHAD domain-containing protein n=1 Tax=Glaciihabitans sp. INWT7 TaxID=2596912 RepID=UPI001629EF2B|nr:CYTH and CHAD domain-containing protein [Glaciihabitans sp. INWT7]QNE48178.1 CYTH and CHAD domain-containing protein [Glaciihabitans sp. INWT7]
MVNPDSAEIERKYDVTSSTALPDLPSIDGVFRVEESQVFDLDAVYFDTANMVLAAHHITLRRRTGGDDAGWHLKLPVSDDERSELHEPLGSDPQSVPHRLLEQVAVLVRSRELTPVVHLITRRTVHRLRGRHDELLALFCDDEVTTARLAGDPLEQQWREWELELVDGQIPLLDAAERLFSASRVSRSDSRSKLARALGDGVPQHPAPAALERDTAGALLVTALREYRDELVRTDPLVREDRPESIHDMRVATAKFRAAVGTFHSLIANEDATTLRTELGWIGHILGGARDLDVIAARLAGRLRTESEAQIIGPVGERISHQLSKDSSAAKAVLLESLDSPRYFRLLDQIDAFVAHPPLRESADAAASGVLPGIVDHRIRALFTAMHDADQTIDRSRHDLALHEVRKAAKEVRYAAEVLLPIRPNRARRLAKIAKLVQDTLGEQHDSVVARQTLERLSAASYLLGDDCFTYGRLHRTEQDLGEDAEARYEKLLRRIPKSLRQA